MEEKEKVRKKEVVQKKYIKKQQLQQFRVVLSYKKNICLQYFHSNQWKGNRGISVIKFSNKVRKTLDEYLPN